MSDSESALGLSDAESSLRLSASDSESGVGLSDSESAQRLRASFPAGLRLTARRPRKQPRRGGGCGGPAPNPRSSLPATGPRVGPPQAISEPRRGRDGARSGCRGARRVARRRRFGGNGPARAGGPARPGDGPSSDLSAETNGDNCFASLKTGAAVSGPQRPRLQICNIVRPSASQWTSYPI